MVVEVDLRLLGLLLLLTIFLGAILFVPLLLLVSVLLIILLLVFLLVVLLRLLLLLVILLWFFLLLVFLGKVAQVGIHSDLTLYLCEVVVRGKPIERIHDHG